MEHVLVTRNLEFEKAFFESEHLNGEKLVLRSYKSIHQFLEIKTCATAIIDESIIYQTKEHPETRLEILYRALIKNNSTCLVLFFYLEDSPLVLKLKKKNPYTLFLKQSSFNPHKLNFIFEVNMHQEFRAMFTKDLVASEIMPFDLYLHNPVEGIFVNFIQKNQPLKKEILERLEEGNVSQLFVRSEDFSDFLKLSNTSHHFYLSQEMHHLRKKYKYLLNEITDDSEREEWSKGRQIYQEMNLLYEKIRNLVAKFDKPAEALKSLTFLRKNPVAMGLNCAIHTVAFAKILGLNDEKELCFAALIFSCGKAQTHSQDEIQDALGDTNQSVKASYLRHVDYSLKVIDKKKIPVELKTLSSIRHYAEHHDGSGYPLGLSGDEIPLGAQLLGVIESFNNLYVFRQNHHFRKFKSAWRKLREDSKNSSMGAKHAPELLDEIEKRLTKRGIL